MDTGCAAGGCTGEEGSAVVEQPHGLALSWLLGAIIGILASCPTKSTPPLERPRVGSEVEGKGGFSRLAGRLPFTTGDLTPILTSLTASPDLTRNTFKMANVEDADDTSMRKMPSASNGPIGFAVRSLCIHGVRPVSVFWIAPRPSRLTHSSIKI
jgi:hypothetical protein